MIDQQIQTLNTYNIAVNFGFNNGDKAYDCDFLMTPPNKQMFEVKEFMVNIMNKKNGEKICCVDDFYFRINGEEFHDEKKCISDIKFVDINFEDKKQLCCPS